MVTRPPSSRSASDSIVPKCSIIPVNIAISRITSCLVRCGVRRTCRRICGRGLVQPVAVGSVFELAYTEKAVARCCTPTEALPLAINVFEVGYDGYVRAELLDADIWQRCWARDWHVREWNACFAG